MRQLLRCRETLSYLIDHRLSLFLATLYVRKSEGFPQVESCLHVFFFPVREQQETRNLGPLFNKST